MLVIFCSSTCTRDGAIKRGVVCSEPHEFPFFTSRKGENILHPPLKALACTKTRCLCAFCVWWHRISIFPTVSKVIERAAHMQLYNFLESHQLLVMIQFGFCRGRSTPLALTQFTDEMLANIDNGLKRTHFFRLKKAFDLPMILPCTVLRNPLQIYNKC